MFTRSDGSTSPTIDLVTIKELATGYQTAQFAIPYSVAIQEEEVIEINDYLYKVKEVNATKNDRVEVYCLPFFGQLKSKRIDSLIGLGKTFEDCLKEALQGTDWSYEIHTPIAGAFGLTLQYMTVFDAIERLKELYQCEYYYDTKEKKINVWARYKMGRAKDLVTFSRANAHLKFSSNSYDLVTRLIPIGKNNSTINVVNDGCIWLENHQYTDEIITAYYVINDIDNPNDLKDIAEYRLKVLSRPAISYTINTDMLGQTPLDIGDSVIVLDSYKKTKETMRVSKVKVDSSNPSNSYIVVGDALVSFDDIYKELSEAQAIVNKNTLNNITELSHSYWLSTGA